MHQEGYMPIRGYFVKSLEAKMAPARRTLNDEELVRYIMERLDYELTPFVHTLVVQSNHISKYEFHA
jgi:hypothetical protein